MHHPIISPCRTFKAMKGHSFNGEYLSQNPSLSWWFLTPYFICQFISKPEGSQLAFLNHRVQPESHRALYQRRSQPRKVTLVSLCVPEQQQAICTLCLWWIGRKNKLHSCLELHLQFVFKLFSGAISGWIKLSQQSHLENIERVNSIALNGAAVLWGFIFLRIHPASMSCIDFCLQILIDVSIHTVSEANWDNLDWIWSSLW